MNHSFKVFILFLSKQFLLLFCPKSFSFKSLSPLVPTPFSGAMTRWLPPTLKLFGSDRRAGGSRAREAGLAGNAGGESFFLSSSSSLRRRESSISSSELLAKEHGEADNTIIGHAPTNENRRNFSTLIQN